jgi:hypothetical protein
MAAAAERNSLPAGRWQRSAAVGGSTADDSAGADGVVHGSCELRDPGALHSGSSCRDSLAGGCSAAAAACVPARVCSTADSCCVLRPAALLPPPATLAQPAAVAGLALLVVALAVMAALS